MRINQLLLPLLIVVALYFLFLRPQRARQRKAQELSNNINPGQRVMTTAGMFATVVSLDDEGVLLEIAPGVQVRYVRAAISRVVDTPAVDAGDEDGIDRDVDPDGFPAAGAPDEDGPVDLTKNRGVPAGAEPDSTSTPGGATAASARTDQDPAASALR